MKLTFVVRRGALRRFDRLKRATTDLPVDVIWDRRASDRPVANAAANTEQRLIERRQQPSFTWTLADFAVVEDEEKGSSESAGCRFDETCLKRVDRTAANRCVQRERSIAR